MKEREKYVLTTGSASAIRNVLSLVLAGAKSESGVAPEISQSLEVFSKSGCDKMLLELREAEDRTSGVFPMVRKLRLNHLGQVLVVTGEFTAPGIVHSIESLQSVYSKTYQPNPDSFWSCFVHVPQRARAFLQSLKG